MVESPVTNAGSVASEVELRPLVGSEKKRKLDTSSTCFSPKKLSSSVVVPSPSTSGTQAPVSKMANFPVVQSYKVDVPRQIPTVVSKSNTFDDLSATNTSFEHGINVLPAASDRVKIVNPNGYSLNYVPKHNTTVPPTGKYNVLSDLHVSLDRLQVANIDYLERLTIPTSTCPDLMSPFSYDNCTTPKSHPKRRIGIDSEFRSLFPDRHSLENIHDTELPSVPVCPDTYFFSSNVLDRPKMSQSFLDLFPNEARIYSLVRNFEKPNYRGARIPISKFPMSVWAEKLANYDDRQLIEFLQFGWPVGYEGDGIPCLNLRNHPSSTNYQLHIENYLSKELSMGALKGPFPVSPFEWLRLNPLMTRPKKDSGELYSICPTRRATRLILK